MGNVKITNLTTKDLDTCEAGTWLSEGSCEDCPENHFCTNNNKTRCPPLSTSPAKSSSVTSCQCRPGTEIKEDKCLLSKDQ